MRSGKKCNHADVIRHVTQKCNRQYQLNQTVELSIYTWSSCSSLKKPESQAKPTQSLPGSSVTDVVSFKCVVLLIELSMEKIMHFWPIFRSIFCILGFFVNLIKVEIFSKHCVCVLLVVHQTCVNKPWFTESLSGEEAAKKRKKKEEVPRPHVEKLFSTSNFLLFLQRFSLMLSFTDGMKISPSPSQQKSSAPTATFNVQFYSMQYISWFP